MHTAARLRLTGRIAKAASAVVLLTGIAVILGWTTGAATPQSILPGLPKMAPGTALLFILMGAGLWGVANDSRDSVSAPAPAWRWVSRSCAAVVVASIGGLRLLGYSIGRSFGLDRLWFHERAANSLAARVSPATALAFVLLGCALLLAGTKLRFPRVFQSLVLLAGLVAFLGFSHYVYGGEPLLPYGKMAVHTALMFLILTAGLLSARPDFGMASLLVSDSAGGMMARRLVPSALFIPFVIGWLRLEAQRAGWFGTEAGISLFALANVVVFGSLIWATAALLHRSDSERTAAEKKVGSHVERLNLLHEITRAIGVRLDLGSIYQVVSQSIEENLKLDFDCICDYDPALHELIVVHVGVCCKPLALKMALADRTHVPIDANGLTRCVGGELVYEPEIAEVPMAFPQRLASGGLHSLVVAPLRVESKVFGVLIAARREPRAFSSGECEFLRQLCEHVALAAHQVELHSALQQAYDELRQTQDAAMQQERLRALGQMASGIAHDINNAISPLLLFTESLLETERGLSDRARKQLEMMRRGVTDVAQTVARLREFYRKRESQQEQARVDVNGIVRQVIDMTRARWSDMPQQRGVVIEMRTDLAADLPSVLGVESELREAMINLIFNAVDAMPEGGMLTLRTRIENRADKGGSKLRNVVVEVVDSGIGMDQETRKRCAEPFFSTKGDRGTGLGLAMVYGIARRHGTDMEIESAPGAGTTIRLSFSAAQIAAPSVEAETRSAPPVGLRILVIDDDPSVLKALRDVLEIDGHLVIAANGGKAGIDEFRRARERREHFAVVLTDLGMPHMDGRQVANAIKEASPETPVILLTGWGQRLTTEGETPPHVDRVLSKPPKLRELREALALCLNVEKMT
jgi:signal transduction histidine kinase/ActR/RegA family two-component response regulator